MGRTPTPKIIQHGGHEKTSSRLMTGGGFARPCRAAA